MIWPVSSALLATALAYGNRALIGPFLASFLYIAITVTPAYVSDDFLNNTLIAAAMTLISGIRIWVLITLCKRFIGDEQLGLDSPKQMLRLLVIAGPIGGILGMLSVFPTIFAVPELSHSFRIALLLRWWLAMTTGGMIFTPLLLKLLQKPAANPTPRLIYLSTSAAAISLFFGMLWFIRLEISNDTSQAIQKTRSDLQDNITGQFQEIVEIANSIGAGIIIKPDLSVDDFEQLTKILHTHNIEIVEFLSWSPYVNVTERKAFETSQQCVIKSLGQSGLVTSNEQSSYIPIKYLFPKNVADQVLCFDLLSESLRATAIETAMNSKSAALTKPLSLANNNSQGVLLVSPVFAPNGKFLGIVSVVIALDEVIFELNKTLSDSSQSMKLDFIPNIPTSKVKATRATEMDARLQTLDIDLIGHPWRLTWRTKLDDIQIVYNWQINLFTTIGSLIVILIQFIAYRLVLMNQQISSEVASQTKLLEEAKRSAEIASITKGQFLANMSHEIRTPLNAILGFAELAKLEKDQALQRDYINGIWSSSEALISLVNDVLDYSKIEAGKLELHPNQFTIAEIALRLKAIFAAQIENKGLSLLLHYDQQDTRTLVADDVRIQQILINLCSNAVKFTNKGHILIDLQLEGVGNDNCTLKVRVEDTGIGISAAEQNLVFEEFTQADSSISRKYGGTGLGLAISYNLTKLLGGTISLRSVPNSGSTFLLTIPVKIYTKKTQQVAPPKLKIKRNILLVDDNVVNLKVTKALLNKSGFDVRTADNGFDAIDAVHRKRPDLVFMDMQMPELDGIETTKRLRKFYPLEQLVIVGLTANAAQEDRDNCIAAGMNDYLTKPISLDKLSQCLTRWLP